MPANRCTSARTVLPPQQGAGAAKEAETQIRATCLTVHDPVPQTGTAQTPPRRLTSGPICGDKTVHPKKPVAGPITFHDFARRENVRLRRDECSDSVLVGKCGHVFDYGSGRFGLCLTLHTKRQWSAAKRKLLAARFTITQDGDTEGVATFDPADAVQVSVAFKLAGIRHRRKPSPANLAALATARSAALRGRTSAQKGVSGGRNAAPGNQPPRYKPRRGTEKTRRTTTTNSQPSKPSRFRR